MPRGGRPSTRPRLAPRLRLRRICAALACVLFVTPVAAEPPHHPGGFWKCKTDNKVAAPEFDGEDPVGLASGKHIPTDCAIHWSDGHGKTYCFASLPSLNVFDSELGLRDKAQAFWTKEHGRGGGSSE